MYIYKYIQRKRVIITNAGGGGHNPPVSVLLKPTMTMTKLTIHHE